jgi:hypothetical protein
MKSWDTRMLEIMPSIKSNCELKGGFGKIVESHRFELKAG